MITIRELEEHELQALVGLAKLVVRADHQLDEGEVSRLNRLAEEIGGDLWRRTLEQARAALRTVSDAKAAAHKVVRSEARELIFQRLVDLALPGSISSEEASILEWLAKEWHQRR